ncbi:MAG: 4Fe-4S binding protein [Bacilli bacterium]|jgi:2-oxoglutarate ferredoxin oxidoreductase subunit delta|nr:4Fe-4S binding protein [Bacilli bacterium]MDY0064122.1 4Fe-4S binding protein [Bacilli bacterium]
MAKGKIYFDYEHCKGCMLCVHYCPTKILELDKTRINKQGYPTITVTNPDKCIGCAFCAIMCPDSVITVERITNG